MILFVAVEAEHVPAWFVSLVTIFFYVLLVLPCRLVVVACKHVTLKPEDCQLVFSAPQISSIDFSMMINVFKCFQLFLFSHCG
jgi:hypothetical protein